MVAMIHRCVRVAFRAGLTMALVMAAGCTSTEPTTPVQTDLKVLTYNTRGMLRADGVSYVDSDKWRFVEVLAGRIIDERPDVVLLQETCTSQATRLADLLSGRHDMTLTLMPELDAQGRDVLFDHEESRRCPGTDLRSGKAILTVGPAEQIAVPTNLHTGSRQGCVRWTGQRGPIAVCVLHVTTDEAKGIAPAFATWKGPLILGGDFKR